MAEITVPSLLQINATPVFYANYEAYKSQKYPVIVNEGGSRSSKSYSLMQLMILIALEEPGKRISIVSHSLPHVKRGVYRDFKVIMESWHLWDDNSWMATDFVYYFPNGSYLELIGLDDESRARGPGRDILWLNEANLIKQYTFQQLAMRTTGIIFADLNPSDFNCWCYELADNPKNKKVHSTYRQNLPNLSHQQIELLESYRDLSDTFMYDVFCLGLRGASKELIYTAWKVVADLPGKGEVFYGLDFGYTAPTAMVKVEYYEGQIYVQEIIYQTKLTVSDIVTKLKNLSLSQSVEIFCDAAEPKSIEELHRAGYNAKAAEKDVWGGIMKVKSYNVFVTNESHNLKKELQGYKWMTDKDGNITNDEKPVKENDHLLDAMRYAIFTKLSKPQINMELFMSLNK